MRTPEESVVYEVVFFRGTDQQPVYSGDLEECEDWLALNGDSWSDGHYEIRPANELKQP